MRTVDAHIVRVKLIRSGVLEPRVYEITSTKARKAQKSPPAISRLTAVMARRAGFKQA